MDLYLVRHGNTFAPGEKVVWVGSRNDLPLVEKGLEQANAAGRWFAENAIIPSAIYCGPLSRTRTFAGIISTKLALASNPIVDDRLNELDYGEWSGLSDAEVIERFGEEDFKGWRDEARWPKSGNWGKSERDVTEEAESFLKSIALQYAGAESVIAVSSNGRLKFFLKACKNTVAQTEVSVKTGNICKLRLVDGVFEVEFWNKKP